MDLKHHKVEPLYVHDSLFQLEQAAQTGDFHDILLSVSRAYIYEEDQEGYLAFFNPDTIVARIQKSPYGRLEHCFRMRDKQGNYVWQECVVILLNNGREKDAPLLLTATKSIHAPIAPSGSHEAHHPSLNALLWQSFVHHTKFCYFWKDRERRFLGATDAFLKFYGFRTDQEILGKTDEDMNWHLDNNSYRLDEIEVIQKGRVIENVAGDCIIHGVLRHITCYKWPLYRDGVIIGLMGIFFEADDMYRKLHQNLPSPYEDPITGLHNRQGFLGDLLQYQEAYAIDNQPYTLILLESRFDERIQRSYGSPLLRALIRKEASILRDLVGKDSVIARVQHAMFAILRRENGQQDAADAEDLARILQSHLQSIHQIDGNPVTITFQYSIVHATDPAITRPPTAMSATSTAWRWSGCVTANKKSRNNVFLDFLLRVFEVVQPCFLQSLSGRERSSFILAAFDIRKNRIRGRFQGDIARIDHHVVVRRLAPALPGVEFIVLLAPVLFPVEFLEAHAVIFLLAALCTEIIICVNEEREYIVAVAQDVVGTASKENGAFRTVGNVQDDFCLFDIHAVVLNHALKAFVLIEIALGFFRRVV